MHNNAEDWAARARAWAAAKQMEDQYQQSQFTPVGRPEEQTQFQHQEQYPPVTNAHYQDIQQQPYHALGYQQFSASAAIPNQPPALYPQDSFNSSQPSRASDGRVYAMDGGMPAGGAPSTSPSVHQQEVPSSYSSVTGNCSFSILLACEPCVQELLLWMECFLTGSCMLIVSLLVDVSSLSNFLLESNPKNYIG